MQLCMVTRFRKVQNMMSALEALGLPQEAVLLQLGRSALLKPLFLVVKDEASKTLYVLIRGTTSIRDLFTTLTGTPSYLLQLAPVSFNHGWTITLRMLLGQTP